MLDGLAGDPVSVQTSCAAISTRFAVVALAAAPPRSTVAVAPSMITPSPTSLVPGGNSESAALASHGVVGLAISAETRLLASVCGDAPSGTNTESGTSVESAWSKKYRSCAL